MGSVTEVVATVCAKSLQSCLTLYNSMDCSLPGSSVYVILQARIWSGFVCPPPDLPHPGMELLYLMSPVLTGGFFTTSTAWEAQKKVYSKSRLLVVLGGCSL